MISLLHQRHNDLTICSLLDVIFTYISNFFVFVFQIELNYRVAFRASSGHTCDANTIRNGTLLSGEGSLQCVKGCSDTITTMSYYCTDFSATEDWTSGTNSVKYNLSASSNNLFTFGYVFLPLVEKVGKRENDI